MRALADTDFNPTLPLQTITGTAQALRCGKTRIFEMIRAGHLEKAILGNSTRITTASIYRFIEQSIERNVNETRAEGASDLANALPIR